MAFWKPGTIAPGSSIDRADSGALDAGGGGGAGAVTGRVSHVAISERRNRLPIARQREALLYLLEQHPVVILQSPTGTGKSTQLPQFLLEAGWAKDGKCIAVTQPRSVRFEALNSADTRVLYLTDGMLFREILLDPLLSRYSVIMVDEAHERSCYTDLLLGVLKKIRRVRPELRIVISSATIEAQSFVDFFSTTPPSSSVPSSGLNPADDILPPPTKKSRWDRKEREQPKPDEAVMVRLEGRAFPVEIAYLEEPTNDVVLKAVETVFDIHLKASASAALLPQGAPLIKAYPLHSGLSTESQIAVFEPAPPRTRKVIVSTNVAEASVTIDGIKFVVDSGLVKLRSFDPSTGMDALVTTSCSLASLAQRAGRAGRTSPGKCFRLFPSSALASLLPTTPPEITRSDISLLVLQLKSLGIQNLVRFDWMTSPSSVMLERALEFLYCLGALDDEGKLTKPLGVRMAEMPIDPMMSKINVFILDDGDSIRGELERRKFTVEEGDHLSALNAYNAFVKYGRKSSKWCHTHRLNFKALSRALSIRTQLAKYLKRFEIPIVSCGEDHTSIRRCLTSGYFRNAAVLQPDGTYRSVREGAILHAHPSSVLFSRTPSKPFVIFHEVIETTKGFMREITVIEQDWLVELAGHYYSFREAKRGP
ncbi:hypothetical protein Rhopal_001373-T1 [Rhodotorula paludigena]|uniref:RNA helicase n=1 Tax=Rhodotorula paludigena TaxID=86838 RepID=A0AAV5GGF2_9BASI|nr:hypothetical protein Rhopal_001373-T1 [Rhodotorula paludigena]